MNLIDAHQHFWQYNPQEYSWIENDMEKLKQNFLPEHLVNEMKVVNASETIAVQARQTLKETNWLLELAEKNDFIKGVVGWVDLCSDKIEDQLIEFSAHPKFVGVRHVIHDEPDEQFMARVDFQFGISQLHKYGLTYDLLLFPKHIQLATNLVHKFPEQKFVLDHIGKPDIKNKKTEPWASDIRKLAKFPNVYSKLSGMVTEADWSNWEANDFTSYLDTVFDAFGPNRLMIGSDWPVCTIAGSYSSIMEIVINYIAKLDYSTREKILVNNCLDFYFNK